MDGAGHRASAAGPGGPAPAAPAPGGEEDTMRLYAVFQNSFNKIASTPGGAAPGTAFRNIDFIWKFDAEIETTKNIQMKKQVCTRSYRTLV